MLRRIDRSEVIVAAVVAAILVVLVIVEPDIISAPFASARAIIVTAGGTGLAIAAFVVLLRLGVHPLVRILALGIPFALASWWMLEPYFVDDVVDDEFVVSIDNSPPAAGDPATTVGDPLPDETDGAATPATTTPATTDPAPVLITSGSFSGLAGHDGRGDAAVFGLPEGGFVLRFENFDIDNGPDLRVYLVPGEGQSQPAAGFIDLGSLRGNIGNQTYEISASFDPMATWTALIWCEAFSVPFVAATLEQV